MRVPRRAESMNTITIGNFDGIHIGHLKVIGKAMSCSGDTGLVCFEPVARQYFADRKWNRRLTTSSQRSGNSMYTSHSFQYRDSRKISGYLSERAS